MRFNWVLIGCNGANWWWASMSRWLGGPMHDVGVKVVCWGPSPHIGTITTSPRCCRTLGIFVMIGSCTANRRYHCAESNLLPKRVASGDRLWVGSQREPVRNTWLVKVCLTKRHVDGKKMQRMRELHRGFSTHAMGLRTLDFLEKSRNSVVLQEILPNKGSTTKGICHVCRTPHGLSTGQIARCRQYEIPWEQDHYGGKDLSNIGCGFFWGTKDRLEL